MTTARPSLYWPSPGLGEHQVAPDSAPGRLALVSGSTVGLSSDRVALLAKALGHPARVEIVKLLRAKGPLFVGTIVAASGLAQSTVSEHLRILRTAGMVSVRRDGPRSVYSLRASVLRALAGVLDELGSPSR